MGQRDDFFFFGAVIPLQKKLHVYRIRMANRNSRLQPAELDGAIPSEWIGAHLKIAKMLLHFTHMLARETALGGRLRN